MTPELQRYYEDTIALFKHPGWKYLVEDLGKLRGVLADVRNCTNLERAKGEVSMLDHFLGLPELFESTYADLQADESDAPQKE